MAGRARVNGRRDRNRERADYHLAAIDFKMARRSLGFAALNGEIASEIFCILCGLQSHEIIMAESPHRLPMFWKRLENVGRRTWDMKEETDRIIVSSRPQLSGERQQMIIMDPD